MGPSLHPQDREQNCTHYHGPFSEGLVVGSREKYDAENVRGRALVTADILEG